VSPSLLIPGTVVLIAALVAALTDVLRFRVSNLLTLPLLAAGLIYHGLVGGLPALAGSLLGVLLGFGVLFVFYRLGGMGFGDVKLLAAMGAWLGILLTFYLFLASSLAAGVYAVVLIVLNARAGRPWRNLNNVWRRPAPGGHAEADDRVVAELNRPDRRRRVIPFAAMIAVGVVALLAWSLVTGLP